MNRRGFLGMLAGAAAGMAFDPEKLLWVKGAKTISVPSGKVFQPQWKRIDIVVDVAQNPGVTVSQFAFYVPIAKFEALRPLPYEVRERGWSLSDDAA